METTLPSVTVIGITGTMGAGKSAVGKILQELGVPVIDSDEIVHTLLASDRDTQNLIIQRFGSGVVSASEKSTTQQIDRKALGAIVFADKGARKDLENILHPRVRSVSRQLVKDYAEQGKSPVVAALVPLLFEANLQGEYNQIWTVITSDTVLRERLRKREGLSDEQIEQRLACQLSQKEKSSRADKVIDNSGDLLATRKQVVHLVNDLIGSSEPCLNS
jgi:dephospho-CoA kinase